MTVSRTACRAINTVMREVQFGVYRGASGFVQEEVSWDWVGLDPWRLPGLGS